MRGKSFSSALTSICASSNNPMPRNTPELGLRKVMAAGDESLNVFVREAVKEKLQRVGQHAYFALSPYIKWSAWKV